MSAEKPLRVSGVLVVHNEEKFVGQCLASMAPLCDEILVAHDGPCSDRSLEIARKYTRDVFVHEARGAPEGNLIKLLRRTKHEWILRLDCDETISPNLQRVLYDFKESPTPGITQVSAIWRAIYTSDDESPARPHEEAGRRVLFQKSRAHWIGLPHNSVKIDGPNLPVRECIYHYAPHQQYGVVELLTKKLYPFSKKDAALRMKHPIESFGYDGLPIEKVLRPVDKWRNEYPLAVGGILGVRSFLKALHYAVRADNLREIKGALRWPIPHGAYQLFLAYHIHKLRREGHRPKLARDDERTPVAAPIAQP